MPLRIKAQVNLLRDEWRDFGKFDLLVIEDAVVRCQQYVDYTKDNKDGSTSSHAHHLACFSDVMVKKKIRVT